MADTGTLSTDVDEVYYEVSPDSIPTSGGMDIIANTRSASSNNYKIYGVIQANGKLKMYYGSTIWYSTTKMVVGGRYIIKGILKESQLKMWINGNLEIDKTITGGPTAGVKNTIGAWNGNGNISASFKGKIYFARFWKDGLIVRDFVPVQKSDGTIGLLDLVNNTFYGNSGTGTFTAGPECPQGFPTSEYCLVEWLESTGTLYILTDYYPTNNIQLQARACRMGDINDYLQLFGCRGGGAIVGLFLRRKNDTNCAYDLNSRGSFSKLVFPNDTFVDIDINKNVCKVNGKLVTSVTESTFTTTTYPFLLFAHNNIGTPVDFLRGRVSRIKITDGSIQHDYISCYRRSDMKPGMYDLVGRLFYTNSGTGEFLLGPSITFGWGEVVNNVGATLNAIPHNISTGDGRNGEKNGAFHFDGTSYMEVDAGSILPANCTKYTIMMWTKVDTSGVCALFSLRNLVNHGGRCVLYYNTNMYYDDGKRSSFSHGVTRNNWNHYAFVRNGSNKYVYVNGQLVNTSSASTAGVFSPVLTIGACLIIDSGVVLLFIGDMKDIKIFDTNLDASGIQQEM